MYPEVLKSSLKFYIIYFPFMHIEKKGEHMKNTPPTEQLLRSDLLELPTRVDQYRDIVASSDLAVVTFVCSDSRVSLPINPVELEMEDGTTKKTVFVGIPTIGGGLPSRSRFRGVIQELQNWGVSEDKIHILATQHGDSDEIEHSATHPFAESSERITCGLRNFLSGHKTELTEIRNMLIPWSDDYKRRMNDITRAPDRLDFSVLEKECPDILEKITALSESTGEYGLRIPRRLLLRAAYRNENFGIEENGESVRRGMAEYMRHPEFESLRKTARIGLADYDHQKKSLVFARKYATLGFKNSTMVLPDLIARTDTIQNPEYVVVSLGNQMIPLHDGALFPHIAGALSAPDNAFKACASIPTSPTILCAMAESSYAVLHHVHPHAGDKNFSALSDVIFACQNTAFVDALQTTITSAEFAQEYAPMFHELHNGIGYVVNLHLGEGNEVPTMEEIHF